jgi:hypothetical protein
VLRPFEGKCGAMIALGTMIGVLLLAGCSWQRGPAGVEPRAEPVQVVVVAPVLNLSNSTDWDPLKVTDILASEFQSFPDIVVIPVNRTLAALALCGKSCVETPQDALDLARELHADATVVTAITEYDPYEPPRVGLVMQWYAPPHRQGPGAFDPVVASRQAADVVPASSGPGQTGALVLQIQQVYNAAEDAVLADARAFGARRSGHDSPYGAGIYVKSQELFVRYCCWTSIRTMVAQLDSSQTVVEEAEAKQ